jgi:hypothetical protein
MRSVPKRSSATDEDERLWFGGGDQILTLAASRKHIQYLEAGLTYAKPKGTDGPTSRVGRCLGRSTRLGQR